MVSYKELGLVNTKEMFAKAIKGGYAIPAFNFNNMEQLQAIIQAAVETKSPVILQVSKGARQYANQTLLRYMAEGAVEYAKELGCEKPQIVLHLDHGDSFELCKSCIDTGFSSVMIRSCRFRNKNRLRQPCNIDRHIARSKQVQTRTVHKRCQRTSCSSSIAFRRTRRRRKRTSRIPHRSPRFIVSSSGRSRDHQQIRRCSQRRNRYPRRRTPQSRCIGSLQNQHRL